MHQIEWLAYVRVKGTVSWEFLLCIFHESVSHQPQSIPLRPFQIFLKICGDIRKSRCTTMHQYQRHRWQNCIWYQRHRQQICHRYQRHRRQIIPLVSLAVLILVANLSLLSMIPAAICHRYQRRQWQIATGINDTGGKFATGANNTGGKQREPLSNCWQIKLNLKKKLSIC